MAIDAHVQVARVEARSRAREPAARAGRRPRRSSPHRNASQSLIVRVEDEARVRRLVRADMAGALAEDHQRVGVRVRRARRRRVVISADLIIIGDQSGCSVLEQRREAGHVRAGHRRAAVEVEERPAVAGGATAARMSWPGAMTSGLSRSPPPAASGPRDENAAVNGAGTSKTSVAWLIVAVAPARRRRRP